MGSKSAVQRPIKVALIAISYGKGGLERVTALLSQMLTDQGFEVTNILLTDRIDYAYAGKMMNLGKLKNQSNTPWARVKRFRKLKKFLQSENFDWIIDNRPRNAWLKEWIYLDYIYKNQRLIYMIHNFMAWNYLTPKPWMARKMIQKTRYMVAVSQGISDYLKEEFPEIRIKTMYNPVEELPIQKPQSVELPEKYILFLGRLDSDVKNLPLLLESYVASELPQKKIPLVLMGSGDAGKVRQKIADLGLENSCLVLEYDSSVGYYLQQAMFLVLSSKYEGFPMVIIEALSVGSPVVSVDCQTGPREVIRNGENGLLVPNDQPQALAEAMNRMLNEPELYQRCQAGAKASVAHLKPENLAKEWKRFLLSLD